MAVLQCVYARARVAGTNGPPASPIEGASLRSAHRVGGISLIGGEVSSEARLSAEQLWCALTSADAPRRARPGRDGPCVFLRFALG
jgi:hypothetical protein